MRKPWHITVNGIRPQGCEFRSFSDAQSYCLRLISSHVVELQRMDHPLKDRAGETEGLFAHELACMNKSRPLPNDIILVLPGLKPGTAREWCIERRDPRPYGGRRKWSWVRGAGEGQPHG